MMNMTRSDIIAVESQKDYYHHLMEFLDDRRIAGVEIYPPKEQRFAAMDHTAFDDVKVVIIGQDPYHGKGQAMGLSFSVPDGYKIPPSLRNIYKELIDDIGCELPFSGDLTCWADQGVLLLNTILTVDAHAAGSHRKQGWEVFTDEIIRLLSQEKDSIVFVLWGNFAQKKEHLIDDSRHQVLKSVHPSPLSASRGWFGSQPFSRINDYLIQEGKTPIVWG